MCIYRVSLTHVHVCICDSWVDPKFKYSTAPSPQAENIDVCINMVPSMLTDNKKRRKKKLATILCPVMVMLVESRCIFICNSPPPPHPAPARPPLLLIHKKKNKFFDNHEYSRRSLKFLLFLDSRVGRNLWSASFLPGR